MKKNICFLHPDLGIGGAERLVVDAALALISKNHNVHFVTTHHDESHCFAETKDGTFPVTVVGDWIPRNILGRCYALCAYLRMIYAAFYIIFFSPIKPDIIFCDIVSACIPVLKLSNSQVIFYCHFPDQLLSVAGGKLKRIYRAPLNWIEEKTTGLADVILVNSKFTRSVFQKTFPSIQSIPEIIYPSINTQFFDQPCTLTIDDILGKDTPKDSILFLSINRFERKKNISLAIKAFSALKSKLAEDEWNRVRLIIVGGYDVRVIENVDYYNELKNTVSECNIEGNVHFIKSPSDSHKKLLLQSCHCLVYTPANEHFGIVPLEAMYSEKPVIAVNSGGPTETVLNSNTGFLCEPNVDQFSEAMATIIQDGNKARLMSIAGRKRFVDKFSFEAFSDKLNSVVVNLDVSKK